MPKVTKSRSTRTSEKAFEKAFSGATSAYSRHMRDKGAGLPDRYFSGGTWIEFKSFEVSRDFKMEKGLSVIQKRTCQELADGGDKVFLVSLVRHKPTGKNYVIVNGFLPRGTFMIGKGTLNYLDNWAYQYPNELALAVVECGLPNAAD